MKRLLALVAVVAVSVSACGPTDNYALKVNDTTISVSDFEDELHVVTSNPRFSALLESKLGGPSGGSGLQPGGDNTVNSQYTARALYDHIFIALIHQALVREKVTVTPQQRAAAEAKVRQDYDDDELLNSLPANYRDNILINPEAELSALLEARDTVDARRSLYDKDPLEFENYCVRHILVQSEGEAAAVRNRLLNGEDFTAVARSDSKDPGGSQNGGSLDCITKKKLTGYVEGFRDAVLSLPVNELSQPVQTQFGYHVVQVTSKRQLTFDEAQGEISEEIRDRNTFFIEAFKVMKVKVNPRYGQYDPGNIPQGSYPTIVPRTPVTVLPPTTEASQPTSPDFGIDPNTGQVPSPSQ